jgi:hypothetical protein
MSVFPWKVIHHPSVWIMRVGSVALAGIDFTVNQAAAPEGLALLCWVIFSFTVRDPYDG